MAYNDFSRLEKFLPESHKAVIVDEAHHAAAASYLEILSRFDPQVETALVDRREGGELAVSSELIDANPQEEEEGEAATIVEEEEEEDGNSEGGGDDGQVSELEGGEVVDELFPSRDPPSITPYSEVEIESAAHIQAESDSTASVAVEPAPPQYIDEPRAVPMLLDPVSGRARVPLLAFTATWGRADGLALGKVFEKIVWHADWIEMVQAKWCVPTPPFFIPFDYFRSRSSLCVCELILG